MTILNKAAYEDYFKETTHFFNDDISRASSFIYHQYKKLLPLGISFLWLLGVLVFDPSPFGSLVGTRFEDLIHVMDYALALLEKLSEICAVHVFG